MELSHPGADLIGHYEAAILRVLARTTSLASGRQIERLAGVKSHSSAQRALLRLEKIGLVTALANPATITYALNRDHVFWPPIEQILASGSRIDESIVGSVASSLGPELAATVTVAVFGSYARGDATAESDVDILLVFPDDVDFDTREGVRFLVHEVVEKLSGNPMQIFEVQRCQLDRMVAGDDPLVESWRRDARLLSGPSLGRLLLRRAA